MLPGKLAFCSLFLSVPLDSLCHFEGYGVEITVFEVNQVDASDTPLALPQSATAGLSI